MESNVIKRVKNTIERYSMIKKGESILVAFSHGPDSTALFYILHTLRKDYNIKLIASYINHGLRKETEQEEKKAREFCRKYNTELIIEKIDVMGFAKKNHISIEMAARELRYKTLIALKNRLNIDKIATGHTLTDSIETVVLKMIRGASPESLAGIPPVRDYIIRPLIEISREDILSFVKEKNLPFVLDRSNNDLSIKRNFVRHKILPLFKELNPEYEYRLLNLMKMIKDDMDFINKNKMDFNKVFTKTKEGILLDILPYFDYTSCIRRRTLKKLFPDFEYKDIEAVESLRNKRNGYKINVKRSLFAIKEGDKIFIGRVEKKKLKEEAFNKEIKFGNYFIEYSKSEIKDFKKYGKDEKKEFFDEDDIKFPLKVRTRREGDVIKIKEGKKKLKKIFIEKKVPWRKRDEIPVIEDKKGILWVPGVIRACRGLIKEKTERIMELKYRRINE